MKELGLNEKDFKSSRSAEMLCVINNYSYSWNRLIEYKRLPDGYLIFRFKKNKFILVEKNKESIFSLFLEYELEKIKTIKDYNKYLKYSNIKSLEKKLGKPTHWRILDMQIPSNWSNIKNENEEFFHESN